jgi:hypothetical protein
MFLTRVELLRASLQHRALLAKTNAVVGTTHRSFPFRASCRCWNLAASSVEMVSLPDGFGGKRRKRPFVRILGDRDSSNSIERLKSELVDRNRTNCPRRAPIRHLSRMHEHCE